mgnify:FL=1
MIDKIIKRIKEGTEFNNQGYKITSLEVRVNEIEQKYYITLLKEKDNSEYNFLCKDVNSLYNLLFNYGMED